MRKKAKNIILIIIGLIVVITGLIIFSNKQSFYYPNASLDYAVTKISDSKLFFSPNPDDFSPDKYAYENLRESIEESDYLSLVYRIGKTVNCTYNWNDSRDKEDDNQLTNDIAIQKTVVGCAGIKSKNFQEEFSKKQNRFRIFENDFSLTREAYTKDSEDRYTIVLQMKFKGLPEKRMQEAAYKVWSELIGNCSAEMLVYGENPDGEPLHLDKSFSVGSGDNMKDVNISRIFDEEGIIYLCQIDYPDSVDFLTMLESNKSESEKMYQNFFSVANQLVPEKATRERHYAGTGVGNIGYMQIDNMENFAISEFYSLKGEIIKKDGKVEAKYLRMTKNYVGEDIQAENDFEKQTNALTQEAAVYVPGLRFPEDILLEQVKEQTEYSDYTLSPKFCIKDTIPFDMQGQTVEAIISWRFDRTIEDGTPYCRQIDIEAHYKTNK